MDESPVMSWLADSLPLTLLVDLAVPGPPSIEVYQQEHADVDWLPARRTA